MAIDKLKYIRDKLYTYIVPERFVAMVRCGCRVLVPFGVNNSIRLGIIIDFLDDSNKSSNLKKVYSVLDTVPFLDEEMIKLVLWMREKYFCTYFDAVKVILPPNIDKKSNFKFKVDKYIYESEKENLCLEEVKFVDSVIGNRRTKVKDDIICGLLDKKVITIGNTKYIGEKICKYVKIKNGCNLDHKVTKKQGVVLDFLKDVKYASVKELVYFTGCTQSVIKNLAKSGFIEYFEGVAESNANDYVESNDICVENDTIVLTDSQNEIYKKLCEDFSEGTLNLLHGITGSGKTLILLKLMDYVLSQEKGIVYMVPEICLTSQVIRLFKSRYGEAVAIMHSGLSHLQRFEEWKRIKSGKVKIVVGTRMSVFSPVENLGLIVIDEEQEHTYKSEFTPRFNAKDIAKFRAKYNKSMLVLSSATPSIESYFLSQIGKYKLYTLNKRYNNLSLPNVEIVDMNLEPRKGNTTPFSSKLVNLMDINLKNNQQSIILINRRGYHTFARCRQCNEVLVCPNCNISLNYHLTNRRLMCHYCGYSTEFVEVCPKCGDSRILYSGLGTQKVEEMLNSIFPNARILRADSDVIMSEKNYEEIFNEFSVGNYDIMIGTQMIAKGFNFPKVTLVGVLSIDSMIWNNDFRSYEKTFSLITQVVGRSGRDILPGTALIQSYEPENEVVKLASHQDYKSFYKSELAIRKTLLYPPFCDMCVIGFVGKKEYNVRRYCKEFFEILCKVIESSKKRLPVRVYRPIPGSIKKIGDKYRYKIVIKCKENKEFREVLRKTFENSEKSVKISNVNVFVDINPTSTL